MAIPLYRRQAIAQAAAMALGFLAGGAGLNAAGEHPELRWYQAAERMKRMAESWYAS